MTANPKFVRPERERRVDSPRAFRTGWHVGNSAQRAPDWRLHAVDLKTAHTACGLPARSLVVFEELDWPTMLSNDMCADCKQWAR